jgi:hypothetical protein
LLKVVQTAGTKLSLYGSVEARRTVDQWTLEPPQIQVGLRQFGEPRGAFGVQSYVAGTNEATAALKEQAVNAEIQQRAKKAAQEQRDLEQKALEERQAREEKARQAREEEARIAFEEQRQKALEQRKAEDEQQQKEAEAARQKLILATVQGTSYIGTISHDKELQRIRLVFTEQKNFLIRVEASNPDNPKQKQTFTGELVFNPQPEKANSVAYHIKLSPIAGSEYITRGTFDEFYECSRGSLKLNLTDTGLGGEASFVYNGYTIRLQRGTSIGPVATPPPPPAPAAPAPKRSR